MGYGEFMELVCRMREEQRNGGLSFGPEGELSLSEDCLKLQKEVDAAIGMMDGKRWAESWREAAKEGA